MKRRIITAVLAIGLLSGCSIKYTNVSFNQESDNMGTSVLSLNANGSTLETDTDQTADGSLDLSEAIKAAKDAKSLGILGSLGDILGGGEEKKTATAPPAQGELEVIE